MFDVGLGASPLRLQMSRQARVELAIIGSRRGVLRNAQVMRVKMRREELTAALG